MRKETIGIFLIVLMGLATSVTADMTILLKDMGSYQLAKVVNGSDPVGIYQPGQSFDTFCLETNEYYIPGGEYLVTISTVAHYNNYNPGKGYIEFDENHLLIDGDPLDPKTAYLYTKYTNDINWWKDSYYVQNFQNAIHYIEQERDFSSLGLKDKELVELAENAILPGGEWFGMDLGNVRVMNVWYLDGTRSQDQLVMIPAPGALVLASLGIGLVGMIRRKKTL